MKLKKHLSVGAIRHITIEITKDINLPRFNVKAGFKWNVNPYNLKKDGINLGGGFVSINDFVVSSVNKKIRQEKSA